MAKQVFLLVESVYAEEGPGDGIRVLGTFTTRAGALRVRRAQLAKEQAIELRWARTWLVQTQKAMRAAPDPASKQAHDVYISAALRNRAWAPMIRAQEESRATGINWGADGFADDIRRTRELIAKFSDLDTFARYRSDPRIVAKTLKD